MSVAFAPPAPSPTSSAPVETPTAATPESPAGSDTPVKGTDTPRQNNPAPQAPSANSRADRLARLRDKEAQGKAGNSARAGEPAPAPRANPDPPADKTPASPTPDDAPERSEGKSTTIKYRDESGAEKEETVSYEDAATAILRTPGGSEILPNLSKKKVLEIGSKWLRQQRTQDAFGNQAAQWRRAAEGKTPAQAASGPVTAEKPAGVPAQAAQQPSPGSPPSPTVPADQTPPAAATSLTAKIEELRQSFGDEGANLLQGILNDWMQQSTRGVSEREQTQQKAIEALEKSRQEDYARLTNLLVEEKFASAKRENKAAWPQLDKEADFTRVKRRADALAKSGEWDNPFASFDEIFVQACQSTFGDQQAETNALRLEQSRQRQRQGQVSNGKENRTTASPASMTRQERLRAMEAEVKAGGDPKAVRDKYRSLAGASG